MNFSFSSKIVSVTLLNFISSKTTKLQINSEQVSQLDSFTTLRDILEIYNYSLEIFYRIGTAEFCATDQFLVLHFNIFRKFSWIVTEH